MKSSSILQNCTNVYNNTSYGTVLHNNSISNNNNNINSSNLVNSNVNSKHHDPPPPSSRHTRNDIKSQIPMNNNTSANIHKSTTRSSSTLNNLESECNENQKEVDYYFNPTELFRWINYRRWDGARARVLSHPDECSTWVVSRHASDNRVLWRHLPLHLVCMQSGLPLSSSNSSKANVDTNGSNREKEESHHQLELLIESMLDVFPEAASLQDDRGLLPLHLCINNISTSVGPNERVISSLLLVDPQSTLHKDSYGRTPLDLLQEKNPNIPGIDKVISMLNRSRRMLQSLTDKIRQENHVEIEEVKQWAENERLANQRIIMRMEQELADEQTRFNNERNLSGEAKDAYKKIYDQLTITKDSLKNLDLDLEQVRKERDELVSQNEHLTQQLDAHDEAVARMKREADSSRELQNRDISKLKSEVNTARAMAEALETQLRSKFANEQELTNSVAELKNNLSTLTFKSQQEQRKYESEEERLQQEIASLKQSLRDLESKYSMLYNKNLELNEYSVNLRKLYDALNTQYDIMLETATRYEGNVQNKVQDERFKHKSLMKNHKRILLAAFKEHEDFLGSIDSQDKDELNMTLQADRKREHEAVSKIRQEFEQMKSYGTKIQLDAPMPIHNVKGHTYESRDVSPVRYSFDDETEAVTDENSHNPVVATLSSSDSLRDNHEYVSSNHKLSKSTPERDNNSKSKLRGIVNEVEREKMASNISHNPVKLNNDINTRSSSNQNKTYHAEPRRFTFKESPSPYKPKPHPSLMEVSSETSEGIECGLLDLIEERSENKSLEYSNHNEQTFNTSVGASSATSQILPVYAPRRNTPHKPEGNYTSVSESKNHSTNTLHNHQSISNIPPRFPQGNSGQNHMISNSSEKQGNKIFDLRTPLTSHVTNLGGKYRNDSISKQQQQQQDATSYNDIRQQQSFTLDEFSESGYSFQHDSSSDSGGTMTTHATNQYPGMSNALKNDTIRLGSPSIPQSKSDCSNDHTRGYIDSMSSNSSFDLTPYTLK